MDKRKKLIDVFMHMGDHIRCLDEYGFGYDSTLAEAIEDVLAMLKQPDTNSATFVTDNNVSCKWIPVSERLPTESNGTVLICHADKFPYNLPEPFLNAKHNRRVDIGSFSEYANKWYCSMGGTLQDVTHWMPLPEPPKEEKHA